MEQVGEEEKAVTVEAEKLKRTRSRIESANNTFCIGKGSE
jgi:hypothetical protein